MKAFLTLTFAAFFYAALPAPPAHADGLARGYQACLQLLKLSPAKQREVARKSGYSLAQVLAGCRYQKKVGLGGMRRGMADYKRATRGGGGGGGGQSAPRPGEWQTPAPTPAPEPAPRSCWVAAQGYGCTNGGNVSTNGCHITCTGGQAPICWQGSIDVANCRVSQEDSCACH